MADTADIVAQAMADAGAEVEVPETTETEVDGETTETTETTETPETAETPETTEEEEAETPASRGKAKEPDADKNEVVKLLSAHGLKGLALNDKLPTKRARQIVYNALKKILDGHTSELAKRDTESNGWKTRASQADQWDKFVMQPDVAIAKLAQIHPALWGPVQEKWAAKVQEAADKLPEAKDDPQPKPDIKYPEAQGGGEGYTPEQFQKLLDWNRRDAVREANKRIDEILGPIKKREDAAKSTEDRRAQLTVETNDLIEVYGDEFVAAQKDILEFLRTNDAQGRHFTLTQAAQRVMAQARKKTLDQQKNEWMEEQKKLAGGAGKGAGAGKGTKRITKATDLPADHTTDDVVEKALRDAGLIQ